MRKSTTKPRREKAPKRVLALPDLEQSKAPRLAFNRTVVLRYRIHLEQRHYSRPRSTSDSPRCGVWPTRRPTPGCSVLNWLPAFDESRGCADSGSV